MLEGIVVEYHREYCSVELPASGGLPACEITAKPRGRLELVHRQRERQLREAREFERISSRQVAVGDVVCLSETDPGSYVIEGIVERETWLLRKNYSKYSHKPQCAVANADQLAAVIAPQPRIGLNIVDRYFLAAIQGGLEPLLVVNKTDLDPTLRDSVEIKNYRERGFRVFFTAAKHEQGLDELRCELEGKFTAFCGHSGVGKSTILQRLTGADITMAPVRENSLKGRQTTTTARLYHLPSGGSVIDTPGVREFVLAHLTWIDVHDYFNDIAELTTCCSFRDCTHTVEPGCAVRLAIANGKLSSSRLESYIKLQQEAKTQARNWNSA